MGKKNGLFSSVKRCFTPKKKRKTDKKRSNKGKKGKGNWGHVETKSFVPFFRPPSSIEKILGEADQLNIQPRVSLETLKIIEKPVSPKSLSPRASSPKAVSPINHHPHPKLTLHEAFSAGFNGGHPSSNVLNVEVETKKPAWILSSQTYQSDLYPGHALCEPLAAVSSKGGDPSFNKTELKVETSQLKTPALNVSTKTYYQSDLYPEHHVPFPAAASNGGDLYSLGTERKVEISNIKRLVMTSGDENTSALKIQAAFRGYLARRNFRALKVLMRLQAVMRGQNVKRQTMNTMKQMQFLVRVQTQMRSKQARMQEQALRPQPFPIDKGAESRKSLNRLPSGSARNGDWDTSVLTKEEEEARLQKKVEAVVKRERAMAYAYSHQKQCNSNARSTHSHPDLQFNGYPWRWNWFDRYLAAVDSENTIKSITSTPRNPSSNHKMSPQLYPKCYKHRRGYDTPMKDDESLTSCPTFSSPHYMTPTVSAMAKVQANSHRNEMFPGLGTPKSDRRFSFPLTPNHSSLKDSGSPMGRHLESPMSIRSTAVNSRLSTPASVGRKPFNRF